MKERNKNNSIIFLTTLSVYLGLVLVGATPILAQQNPSACNEKELRQEASRKFTEIGLVNEYVYVLPRLGGMLLRTDYSAIGNFAAFEVDIALSQKSAKPEFKINLKKIISRNNIAYTEDLLRNIGGIADITGRSGCQLDEFGCSPFELKLRFDDSEFFAQLKYTRKSNGEAKKFAQAYKFSIDADICLFSYSPLFKLRFEKTEVFARNNQVIIVTRLPRGSLDELLKQDAKAEK